VEPRNVPHARPGKRGLFSLSYFTARPDGFGTFFTLQIKVVFWCVLWVRMVISRSARTIWPVPSNRAQPVLRITTAAARVLPRTNDAFDGDVDDVGVA